MRAWWRRRTLRFRLAAWHAAAGAVLLAGFAATLYLYVSGTMARPLDDQLRRDLADIRRRLSLQPDGRLLWDGRALAAGGRWNPNDPWFELWDSGGRLVRRCWPFTDSDVEQLPVAPVHGRETLSVFAISRDLRLRVLSVPIPAPGGGDPWMMRVITIHQPYADALAALKWIIFTALPAVVALLVVGVYAITRRWLKPLDRMAAAAALVSADDLGRRLPIPAQDDELGRIATVFNLTLDRLEASFTALDRFVADASHELRTPLTTLRSVGEVGLRGRRTADEYREIIGSMLEEAQRLQELVQRLLDLAAAEGGAPQVRRSLVRVDRAVASWVGDFAVLAEARDQRLVVEASECEAETDPVILRQALQNLVENALKFSPEGATVSIHVAARDGSCEVSVSDRGPGLSEDQRAHLGDRFYRPDSGRGRTEGGFGLGLSLTKAYMRMLGGSLEYAPALPRGSVFRLRLPAAG